MKPHSHNLIWASVLTLHLSKELLSHEMTICWWRQKLLSWYVMPYKLKKNISSHEQESAVTPSARLFFFSSFLKQKPQRRDAKKNVHQIQSLQCKHLSNIMTKCNTVEGFVLWLFTLRPHANSSIAWVDQTVGYINSEWPIERKSGFPLQKVEAIWIIKDNMFSLIFNYFSHGLKLTFLV